MSKKGSYAPFVFTQSKIADKNMEPAFGYTAPKIHYLDFPLYSVGPYFLSAGKPRSSNADL